MGSPVQPPPPYRSLPGPYESTCHQTVSPVPVVPRGGCPAYGEKTARRVARYLRSLHIERACVRPFSASSVDFPRRLCNGGEHSSPCASPEAPCGSARSPYRSLPGRLFAGAWRSGKVSPRGEARCSGASGSRILPEINSLLQLVPRCPRINLLQSRPRPAYAARKVGSPPVGSGRAPFGESFDLRRLRPNDSPPVVWRPGLRRLALFRSALRAPVICSPSSCVGQESRLLKPACRSAQTPSGVFLFSGRFAPSSQWGAEFRPPLWLNLICPAQAPAKSDSAAAPAFSCSLRSIVLLN